jgi:tetratricopeptide (TPR) repeat protein
VIELLLSAENELALGLLDRAERTYRTVLEADPRNGIAAVGLSRVALERGDEAGAHALAGAALEIDPENATARRIVDRLDEVARYRGIGGPPAGPAPPAGPTPPPEMEPPPAAANQAAPARSGLLRRILRRS